MDAGSTLFQRELVKRLQEAIVAGDQILVTGNCKTFDDYRYRVGFQSALRQVEGMVEEIAADIDKRNKA